MIIHHTLRNSEGSLVYLQKPMKRVVFETTEDTLLSPLLTEEEHTQFQSAHFISLPYVLFGITYSEQQYTGMSNYKRLYVIESSVGFATTDKLEQIYVPTFHNIQLVNKSAKVCLKRIECAENHEDLVKHVVNAFWMKRFNWELPSCIYQQIKERFYSPLNTLEKWAKKTKEDPNWIPTENDMIPMSSYQQFKDYL